MGENTGLRERILIQKRKPFGTIIQITIHPMHLLLWTHQIYAFFKFSINIHALAI